MLWYLLLTFGKTFLNNYTMSTQNQEARITAQPIAVAEGEKRGKFEYRIKGYAVVFGVQYSMGWYTESVSPNAFKYADMGDIKSCFNHDLNIILGRTTAGTCAVGVDKYGLWYETILPESPNGENVRVAIQRGDVNQCSFVFSVEPPSGDTYTDGSTWIKADATNGRKKPHRILTNITKVYEVGPVTMPASPQTNVGITTIARKSYENATGSAAPLAPIDQAAPAAAIAQRKRELDLLKIENDILGELLAYEKIAAENERQRKKRQAIDFCYSIGINPKGKF
ncbi:MAG: HK97 family phage prohead protease [Saprospiraceae bacterium]